MKSCEQASILWHGTVHHLDIPDFDRRSISMENLTLTSLSIILEKAVDDASSQAATWGFRNVYETSALFFRLS